MSLLLLHVAVLAGDLRLELLLLPQLEAPLPPLLFSPHSPILLELIEPLS